MGNGKIRVEVPIEEIDELIVPVVKDVTGDSNVQTQKVAGTNEVIIKTMTLELEQREALNQALVENFGVNEEKIIAAVTQLRQFSVVDPVGIHDNQAFLGLAEDFC